MKWPGWLAVVLLALASVGCASGPVSPEPLVTVTGHWEGTYERLAQRGAYQQIRMTLRQNGSKVKGQGVVSGDERSVEGSVEGEVFSGQIGAMRFELTVTEPAMTGSAEGPGRCQESCRIKLRRVGAAE